MEKQNLPSLAKSSDVLVTESRLIAQQTLTESYSVLKGGAVNGVLKIDASTLSATEDAVTKALRSGHKIEPGAEGMRKFLETQMTIPVREIDPKIYNTLLDNVFKSDPELFIRNLVLKNSPAASQESINKLIKIAENGDVSPEKLQRIFANTTDKSVDEIIESINKLVTEKPTGWQKQLDELAGTEKVIKETAEVVTETMNDFIKRLLDKDLRKAIIDLPESKLIAQEYFNRIVKNSSEFPEAYTKHLNSFDDWFKNVFKSDAFEAHHMMPKNVLRDNKNFQKILDWARKNGKAEEFNFGGIENGIMLQKRKKNIENIIGDHANHPQYDKRISKIINEIYNRNLGDLSGAFDELKQFSLSLEKQLIDKVVKGESVVNNVDVIWP